MRKTGLLFLYLIIRTLIWAEEEYAPLTYPDDLTFRMGVTVFTGKDLEKDDKYLTFSIPLLIRETLEGITEHQTGEDRQRILKKKLLRKTIEKEKSNLQQLQATRDETLFAAEAAKKAPSTKEIETKKKYLAYLQGENVEIVAPESVKVSIAEGENKERLFNAVDYSLIQYCRKKELQFLIYGSLEKVQNYIFIEVKIFDALQEKDIYTYTNAAEAQELYTRIKADLTTNLAGYIVGRDWTTLIVKTDLPEAGIFVNNSFKGFGNLELRYIKPEPLTVRVTYPGYYQEEKKITPEPLQENVVEFSAQEIVFNKLSVLTVPEGADLYANGIWQGKTPLELDMRPEFRELRLTKEEYDETNINLTGTEKELTITLKQGALELKKLQEKKRDTYYLTLGIWLLFLPVPEYIKSYSADYEVEHGNTMIGGVDLDWIHTGSVGVSLGLFTYSIFTFIDYYNVAKARIQ